MLGTFGGALEARHVDASDGRLRAEVVGDVESRDGVLVVTRVHVTLRLIADEGVRSVAERVHSVYADRCPIYRSLKPSIAISSSLEIIPTFEAIS